MTISGNPHKLAVDIAEGFANVTMATLKKYTPQDLKTMTVNVNMVIRELRQEQIPLEDVMALKKRNMKIQRANQALSVIRNYCKKKRIVL
ncbi:MAG: hypothetical protein OEV42_09795 [Deltaproteobacteria bacterium]|nr:hypothetical protein [Deltaproteobacteria bacterium]